MLRSKKLEVVSTHYEGQEIQQLVVFSQVTKASPQRLHFLGFTVI